MACHCAKNRDSPNCKFSIDIVTFMMNRFYMGYEWEPTPDIAEPNPGSPFTPAVENAVKQIFLNSRLEMHQAFSAAICDGIRNTFVGDVCDFVIKFSKVRKKPFDSRAFLQLCVVLCSYAARSFNRGASAAPVIVMSLICQTVEKLTRKGLFTLDSWAELNSYCEITYPKPAI